MVEDVLSVFFLIFGLCVLQIIIIITAYYITMGACNIKEKYETVFKKRN